MATYRITIHDEDGNVDSESTVLTREGVLSEMIHWMDMLDDPDAVLNHITVYKVETDVGS